MKKTLLVPAPLTIGEAELENALDIVSSALTQPYGRNPKLASGLVVRHKI